LLGLVFGAKEILPREGEPGYVPPKYRWTPIFSGIVQPFAILLEIPSLTEHWYVKQVDGVPVVYRENPIILDVGLAFSIALGVIANIALISRFLERRVYASTIVCIATLTLHDIINIAALIAFGVIHGTDDGFDYSEAFWMCVCSTTASVFTNITLVYDLIRTKQFRHSGSGLSPKQRKLVIVVMILLVYIALGALCFNFLLPEIAFQDALYFTVVSIETIGFGDV
jgi:potassium channel subfamily K